MCTVVCFVSVSFCRECDLPSLSQILFPGYPLFLLPCASCLRTKHAFVVSYTTVLFPRGRGVLLSLHLASVVFGLVTVCVAFPFVGLFPFALCFLSIIVSFLLDYLFCMLVPVKVELHGQFVRLSPGTYLQSGRCLVTVHASSTLDRNSALVAH